MRIAEKIKVMNKSYEIWTRKNRIYFAFRFFLALTAMPSTLPQEWFTESRPCMKRVMRAFFRPVRIIISRKFRMTLQWASERSIDSRSLVLSKRPGRRGTFESITTLGKNQIFVNVKFCRDIAIAIFDSENKVGKHVRVFSRKSGMIGWKTKWKI